MVRKGMLFALFLYFLYPQLTEAPFEQALQHDHTAALGQPACYDPNPDAITVVGVPATTLWVEPNRHRPLDEPSITLPLDLEQWTTSMSVEQKLWLVGKLETQALFGQEVQVLNQAADWIQVAVPDQSTPKHDIGYPGWIPQTHVVSYEPYYAACPIAIVDEQATPLYADADLSLPVMPLSFNTRLAVVREEGAWVQVHTPTNELSYVKRDAVSIYPSEAHLPRPTQQDLVETAQQFVGLPYLWAGTAGFGFDCSGFTHTIYKRHGILIARDAADQFNQGEPVTVDELQPGDLLFFASANGQGRIRHVGMYIGEGKMIHSPNSERSVEIIDFNSEPYRSEFAGARRYLK